MPESRARPSEALSETRRGCPILTVRQVEALGLVAAGLPAKEIARKMGISEAGAKKHIEELRRRYSAANAAELVRRAFECGDLGHPSRSENLEPEGL
jgi:two-component system, NarL family, nitrate/nitrite response regulator NarL